MDTQTQIDRLIELAIVQRAELKKLVSELPQLREHLNAEIERVFESTEPQLRTELEDWTTKQAHDQTVKLGGELEAKIVALSKSLEATTQTRYNAIMAERAQNIDLAKKAEDKLAEVAQAIPVQVKQIVTDELARFPRAGEIDQLRKEFAEPRGLNPRGRWEPGATYYKLDLVAYNGDSYVANEETSEKPNRTSSKWTLNAARGQAGGGGFMSPAIGDYTASMITNVPAGAITSTNVQDAINELAADVDVSQNTLDALVTNADSVTITKGQVVYAFGSVGNRMSVKLALNTGDATSSKTIGVVLDSSIAAGAIGNIRCVGVVDGLTLGSYTEGDVLYLGATAGSVTATKPYAPNHLVYVGIVERANNGNGELYVKIQNGYELDEIHDVQITSAPLAGALLMRDATNSLWKANRLTGTTNQVTVTNADTAVTLSLPTSLASVDSITASASTALTLTGGSTGASLVLGQGASGKATITPAGTGEFAVRVATPSAKFHYNTTSGAPFASDWTNLVTPDVLFTAGDQVQANFSMKIGAGVYTAASTTNLHFITNSKNSGFDSGWVLTGGTGAGQVTNNGYFSFSNILSGASITERARLTSTGNLLIGTTTDAASLAGGLVVNGSGAGAAASSTTTGALRVTGGVGVSGAGYFGGAVTASSTAAGGFGQVSVTNNASAAINNYMLGSTYGGTTFGGVTGNNQAVIEASASASSLYLGTGGGSSIVLAPNRTAALTLASGGAATFAGAVTSTVGGGATGFAHTSATGARFDAISNGNTPSGYVSSTDNGATNWFAGARRDAVGGASGTDRYNILLGTSNLFSLSTAGAATFAGAVSIGNTVSSVSPTSPNRTITIVVGGVTLYIAAKTTND